MKQNEKRKSTQLGLGKVSGDARHSTSKRERFEVDVPESVPPISAPPPSGGPIRSQTPQGNSADSRAPVPRHTLPLESSRPRNTKAIESTRPSESVERTPSPPPATVRSDSRSASDRPERVERIERIEVVSDRPPSSSRGGAPVSRTPIEVTQVDTKRIPRVGASPSSSGSSRSSGSSGSSSSPAGRFPTEEATGRRPILNRDARDSRDERSDGSRTVDGRPIKRADSGRPALGSGRPAPSSGRPAPSSGRPAPSSGRPAPASNRSGGGASGRPAPAPSGRPASGSARPTSARPGTPAPGAVSTGTARSARVSIREDNVGAAIHAEPARGSRRAVPKLLKSKAEIAAAPIDHRAGFLLAHVDGVTTVAGLVDICGMSEDQVNEILERLVRLGIVAVR